MNIGKSCNICSKKTNSYKDFLCQKCSEDISFYIKKRKCLQCGKVIPINSEGICTDCNKYKKNFDIAMSVYYYTGHFRESFLDFKFHDGFFRVKAFAHLMADVVRRSGLNYDCMVPVPMRFTALIKRGYNPPLEMGYCMRKILKIPMFSSCLLKVRKTRTQSGLKSDERRKNIKGAFKVNKFYINKIKDKEILLIDDVLTTGSTSSECAKVLKEAGASGVYVVTLLASE